MVMGKFGIQVIVKIINPFEDSHILII